MASIMRGSMPVVSSVSGFWPRIFTQSAALSALFAALLGSKCRRS